MHMLLRAGFQLYVAPIPEAVADMPLSERNDKKSVHPSTNSRWVYATIRPRTSWRCPRPMQHFMHLPRGQGFITQGGGDEIFCFRQTRCLHRDGWVQPDPGRCSMQPPLAPWGRRSTRTRPEPRHFGPRDSSACSEPRLGLTDGGGFQCPRQLAGHPTPSPLPFQDIAPFMKHQYVTFHVDLVAFGQPRAGRGPEPHDL